MAGHLKVKCVQKVKLKLRNSPRMQNKRKKEKYEVFINMRHRA